MPFLFAVIDYLFFDNCHFGKYLLFNSYKNIAVLTLKNSKTLDYFCRNLLFNGLFIILSVFTYVVSLYVHI